jgi:hypothetical protein
MPATVVMDTYLNSSTPCVRLRCDRCGAALISANELPLDDIVEMAERHRCGD